MPRLTPQLIRHAGHVDRHLPLLLRECRDLESARNELRWMREALQDVSPQRGRTTVDHFKPSRHAHEDILTNFVKRRARGEPLQYILGTQPFGNLEIKCKPGVLIPRYETETYTLEVGRIVREVIAWSNCQDDLSIIDFCTGSGCIALLLHSTLRPPRDSNIPCFKQLNVSAFDISQHALNLSHTNVDHNLALRTLHENARDEVQIHQLDILELAQQAPETISTALSQRTGFSHPHVIISNPPYISPAKYKLGGETARSVRNFEPKVALVPPAISHFDGVDQADQFYAALLKVAVASKTKLLVVEVGDTGQALRVQSLYTANRDVHVEVWRDDSTIMHEDDSRHQGEAPGDAAIEARVIVVWFDPAWAQWRRNKLSQSIKK